MHEMLDGKRESRGRGEGGVGGDVKCVRGESQCAERCETHYEPNVCSLVARCDFLLQVLSSLRPWELRNPDIAAAVEVR